MILPSQSEIDAVAHFREGVAELRISPMFIEEFRTLSISLSGNEDISKAKATLPNEMVVRDVLIPFRRMWQPSEPCFHRRVVNIIAKAEPKSGAFIQSFVFDDKRALIRHMPWLKVLNLTASDLIDLVINTRYMHVGIGSSGRFSRHDYDRCVSTMGLHILEYAFTLSLMDVGLTFINIDNLGCRPFLQRCAEHGCGPSFAMRDTHAQDRIERRTPGVDLPGTTMPDRLWRLRRRNRYDGFNKFLDMIAADDVATSAMIAKIPTFDDLIRRCGVTMQYVSSIPDIGEQAIVFVSGAIDAHHTAMRNRKSRRGFVARDTNGQMYWSEDYLPILRDQYAELREALLQEPFK